MVMFFFKSIFPAPSHIFGEGDRDYLSGISLLIIMEYLVEQIIDY